MTQLLQATTQLDQPLLRKTDAWNHQLEAYRFAYEKRGAMLAICMGGGKTKVVIDLIANRGHNRILIVCPVSVRGVWPREFEKHAATHCNIKILDRGTTANKADTVATFLRQYGSVSEPLVVVVNYEAVWRKPLGDVLLAAGFDCAILDESHRIKSPGGKASRWCQRLGRVVPWRLCLTGTPMPHSPLDLYGQYRFLSPEVFGTNFCVFRNHYAICHPEYKSQVQKWINQDELHQKFYSRAIRCKASDVLDLPPATDHTRTCRMPPAAERIYRELHDEMVVEVEKGVVTAANVLVKLLRLQQISSGYLPVGDDGEFQELHTAKKDVLADLLADLDLAEPVVVFCRFRRDLDAVRDVAEKTGRRYGELSGRQHDLTDHATMPEGIDLYGVQWQSGGVGIDLTRACYCVMYSHTFSLGDYHQAKARLVRPGQTRPVQFYHLLAEKTVDFAIYGALRKRRNLVDGILESLKEATLWA